MAAAGGTRAVVTALTGRTARSGPTGASAARPRSTGRATTAAKLEPTRDRGLSVGAAATGLRRVSSLTGQRADHKRLAAAMPAAQSGSTVTRRRLRAPALRGGAARRGPSPDPIDGVHQVSPRPGRSAAGPLRKAELRMNEACPLPLNDRAPRDVQLLGELTRRHRARVLNVVVAGHELCAQLRVPTRSGDRHGGQLDGIAQAPAHDEIRYVRQPQEPKYRVPDGELDPAPWRERQSEPLGRVLLGAQ